MKISVLGAGQVGGQAAFLMAAAGLADIVLFDAKTGVAHGKALDIGQSLAISCGMSSVIGGENWELTANSNILVVTAGIARRPGMSRRDLLTANGTTVIDVVREAVRWSPDAVVIIVTNPINTMTYLAYKVAGLPAGQIIGMAGVLDNARFSYFIAKELRVGVDNVTSWVIGDHGDYLVPVVSQTFVGETKLKERITQEQLDRICTQTRYAGTEILNYLYNSSAYFAAGSAIYRMVKAIVHDEKNLLPCSVHLSGHYGQNDLVIGVPVVLGERGISQVIEFDLTADERSQFVAAANHIREINRQAREVVT